MREVERFDILTVEAISANKSGARFAQQNLFRYDFLYALSDLLQNFDIGRVATH